MATTSSPQVPVRILVQVGDQEPVEVGELTAADPRTTDTEVARTLRAVAERIEHQTQEAGL